MSTTALLTELTATSVSVSAGNELNTYGTRVSSGGRVSLQAGGAANYYAVYDQINNRDDSTKTRSFFGIQYSKSRSSSSSIENTPLVTRLQSQAELVSNSGGDTLLQGTQVSAGGGRCLSTKLSAFLNGHRHFFWQLQVLPWRIQPHLFDVLPVARLP